MCTSNILDLCANGEQLLTFYHWIKTDCFYTIIRTTAFSEQCSQYTGEPRFDTTTHPSEAYLFYFVITPDTSTTNPLWEAELVSDIDAIWALVSVGVLTFIEDEVLLQIFSA